MCSSLTSSLVVDGGECPLDLVTKPLHETKERAAVRNALDAQIRGMGAVRVVRAQRLQPEEGVAPVNWRRWSSCESERRLRASCGREQ